MAGRVRNAVRLWMPARRGWCSAHSRVPFPPHSSVEAIRCARHAKKNNSQKCEKILNDLRAMVVNSGRVAQPARSFWNENAGTPLELAQKPLTISVHGVKPC